MLEVVRVRLIVELLVRNLELRVESIGRPSVGQLPLEKGRTFKIGRVALGVSGVVAA